MAKKDIGLEDHPTQHEVEVIMTDGSKFKIQTTWGKKGDSLTLDLDPANHPAWQEKGHNFINVNDARVASFKEKFGDFKF